ncbi:MAG: hydroxyacylglutathione hydrolase [Simkaniaceae bacterium]|nr:hydroxyacylglutathione hydrolase [Simkaniaceae bacterium]MCF7851640.1 hydroxyacylglutathione hydrolase [Simkaniaceae bacterium]
MNKQAAVRVWEASIGDQAIRVHLIPALEDNYIYLLSWGDQALVVDPSVSKPVLERLEEEKLELKAILNTHHHADHVGGNQEIKEKTGCRVIGPSDVHIESVDQVVSDGEEIIVGPLLIQVIATPGHTLDHICFYIPDYKILFSGDTLFTGGCGKIFEGTAQIMFESLQKLAALPKDTFIFCGHDYTMSNLEFAREIDPDNDEILKRIREITEFGQESIPSTMEIELKTNPFLCTSRPSIRKKMNLLDATDVEVLAKLRELKSSFK